MLLYNEEDSKDIFNPDPDIIPSLRRFEIAERRVSEKQKLLADVKNELELLKQQALGLYKSHVSYLRFDFCDFKSAYKWVKAKDDPAVDKRRTYPERTCYNELTGILEHCLEISGICITGITTCGLRTEAHSVEFTYHNELWSLYIPMVKEVSIDSYMDIGNGVFKLSLYHHVDHGCCRKLIGSTFYENELPAMMKSGLEIYCKD